jgi:hypothetical protein
MLQARARARSVQRNVSGRKLSCCGQDRAAGAFDPGLVAVAGCFRRRLDCSPGAGASNRDGWTATSGSYPDRPDGIPDQKRSCGGGFQSVDAAGTPTRCRSIDRAETWRVGRPDHNSDIAVRPYRRCRTEDQAKDLEVKRRAKHLDIEAVALNVMFDKRCATHPCAGPLGPSIGGTARPAARAGVPGKASNSRQRDQTVTAASLASSISFRTASGSSTYQRESLQASTRPLSRHVQIGRASSNPVPGRRN